MAYSFAQLEGFWINAGGSRTLAPTMAAIAMAESSGNNVVQQGQPYSTTGWGLWQITPGNSEPSIGTNQQLLNPATNAQAAVAKYNQQGLGAWTTWPNPAQKYLQTGVTPDLSVSAKTSDPAAPATGVGGGTASGGGGGTGCSARGCLIGNPFPFTSGCLFSWCQAKAIISVAEIGLGGVVFVFGVVMLAGYGYDHSGAKQAVNSTTRRIGVGTALLAGQPEAAGAIELASKRGGSRGRGQGTTSRRAPRTDGSGSSTRQGKELLPNWAMPSGKPRTVGLGAGATGRPAPYSRRREQQLEGQAAEGRSPQAKRDTATLRRQVNARNTVSGPSTVAGRSRGQARERTQRRSVHYNEEGVPF